ncbi:hypothetical protein GLOTRDRAFT_139856 [Gloeophyllum trabeum ATCC 11539]|uniref:BZIP domain-containing protein n=1 Tax=Gloeophyllum trabeum (strain ATCC 11539 / FP-39264 / Madison 617) TaxID=670483 RepID=S7Q2F1_GLOTA|nr:uncharacterized protein GLOTRDRAFT_139856 [Gloeophyllum trabeum ATCC 11539]EPQ53727.1 hypothetical protein GLOTRDRAFT_139856 [Gloeophyllum trabeum ATCC 11539]
MQVNSPLAQPFSFSSSSNFEDFFNMDMLGGSTSTGDSPRSSSRSPAESFSTLPSPPAQPYTFPGTDFDSFFQFGLEGEGTKVDALAPPPVPAPYDFLGAFASLAGAGSGGASSGSESSPASAQQSESPAVLAIDPQLVGTPTPSKAQSEFGDDEDNDDEDEEGDEEMALPKVKVGGKGAARKGTVQSGGVTKKTANSPMKSNKEKSGSPELDDWRPSPEEYKKMSSKEKRQLRNKISARNFRIRRKEYITTLEGDVAERDKLIDMIRTELHSTKDENAALRSEIQALKKALLEGRAAGEPSPLPPPGPLPSVQRSSSPLLSPNIQKDIPLSPRLGAKGFWGGSQSFGGITPVHTTIVPEFPLASALLRKPIVGDKPASPPLQENINPSLNAPKNVPSAPVPTKLNGFDSYMDTNPFTMKTLDAYRMQLWGKMAQQQQAMHAQQQKTQKQQGLTGLASSIRPHYFAAPKKEPLSSANNSNTRAPLPGSTIPSAKDREMAQHAVLAAVASQTMLQRLGSAFWEAFSGQSPSSSSVGHGHKQPAWDAEKVRKVLEGTAVVKVVDVEQPAVKKEPTSPKLTPMQTKSQCSSRCSNNCGRDERKSCLSLLEESMGALSLGRKA